MFRFTDKSLKKGIDATTLAELLIIMLIIGFMALIMLKTFKRDTIVTKYLYYNLMQTIHGYSKDGLNSDLGLTWADSGICQIFANNFNTIGTIDCATSSIPDTPNFTTTNGMRFYGLETGFTTVDGSGNPLSAADHYIIFQVDIDGVMGDNVQGSDILAMELRKNAMVTPIDTAAKDPDIIASRVIRVFDGTKMVRTAGATESGAVLADASGQTVFSYDEASCLAFGQATKTIAGGDQKCSDLVVIENGMPQNNPSANISQLANCIAPNKCKITILKPKLL